MAEQPTAAPSGKLGGWVKAVLGTLGGLLSGAFVMYLTPVFNQAIKPARPVANFSYQRDGLTVRFENKSKGDSEGWWDFGDGTPLQQTVDGEFVPHTYAQAGEYTVKLSLRNRFGDENERTAPVRLETVVTVTAAPQFDKLEVIPVSPGSYAPATFRIVTELKNAPLCVWDMGDDRPLEVVTEPGKNKERWVTFQKPGGYVIKVAAVNGTQHVERSEVVTVMESPAGTITAMLNVADNGIRLETGQPRAVGLSAVFPQEQTGDSLRFDRTSVAMPGWTFAEARLNLLDGKELALSAPGEQNLDPALLGLRGVRDLKLSLSPDRQTLRLTGELVRNGQDGKICSLMVTVKDQREIPAQRARTVTSNIALPGPGTPSVALVPLPTLPSDWVKFTDRQVRVVVLDNGKTIWEASQPGGGDAITVANQRCLLMTTLVEEQVKFELHDAPRGQRVEAK